MDDLKADAISSNNDDLSSIMRISSLVYNKFIEFAKRTHRDIINRETRMDLQVRLIRSNIYDVEFVCKQDIASLIRSYTLS